MIIDAEHVFSDKQTVTETGYSTNIVELPSGQIFGIDLSLMVVAQPQQGSSPTLSVDLEGSTDGMTFAKVLTLQSPTAKITFGGDLKGVFLPRYLRCRYVLGGALTVYRITAMLQSGMSFGPHDGLYPASPRLA